MKKYFEPILDDDENIVKDYKPNKLKFFFSSLVASLFVLLFFCGGMAVGLLSPDEFGVYLDTIYVLIPISIFVVAVVLIILFLSMSYKKTFYAVTNKRIIIRTGIIGVDFKSLDMAMIGAIDVNVSVIDKILCKNTGSIRFGSTSSPMNGQNASTYVFKHIVEPYKTCKEIKTYIDEYKKSKQA